MEARLQRAGLAGAKVTREELDREWAKLDRQWEQFGFWAPLSILGAPSLWTAILISGWLLGWWAA